MEAQLVVMVRDRILQSKRLPASARQVHIGRISLLLERYSGPARMMATILRNTHELHGDSVEFWLLGI